MVLDQRGPSWYAVRYGFRSEMAPLGTPFVMVLVQKGPQLALFGARFCLRNVEVGPQINTHLKTICPLRAEPLRCEARRDKCTHEKCTHENCTLPTIHLGPAGRRLALGLVYPNVYKCPLVRDTQCPLEDKDKDNMLKGRVS